MKNRSRIEIPRCSMNSDTSSGMAILRRYLASEDGLPSSRSPNKRKTMSSSPTKMVFSLCQFLAVMLLVSFTGTSRLWLADGYAFHPVSRIPLIRPQPVPSLVDRGSIKCSRDRRRSLGSRVWMSGTGSEGGNHTILFGAATATGTTEPETEVDFERMTSLVSTETNGHKINGNGIVTNGAEPSSSFPSHGVSSSSSSSQLQSANQPDWVQDKVDRSLSNNNGIIDIPQPTINGGYTHTAASKAKISAANKGKTPWNKGRGRSPEVKARIAAGVRKRNRERFLQKLKDMGVTEEEYNAQKAKEKAAKEAEKQSRRTEKGGYRPTQETRKKISQILKTKWANGEVKKRTIDPAKVRRGFTHSEETRAKISASLKQKWATDEDYREKMKIKSSNPSPEIRERISTTLKKKWDDPEFRATMTAKLATRKRPQKSIGPSHREKISASMKAKWQEEAYRKKATEAMAKRQAELARTRFLNPRPPAAKATPKTQSTIARSDIGTAASSETQADSSTTTATSRWAQPISQSSQPKKKVKGARKKKSAATKKTTGGDLNDLRTPIPSTKKKKRTTKTKGTKKKKTTDDPVAASAAALLVEDSNTSTSVPTEEEETTTTSTTKKPKTKAAKKEKKNNKKKKEAPGSVSRLREERRDLYDLLYGDEDDDDDDDDGSAEDLEMLREEINEPNTRLASILGDENLDEFDPYGLEDF